VSVSAPSVFISYSHEDESFKDRVVKHLAVLERTGQVALWNDRQIAAGDDWRSRLDQALAAASIALLLVSANSLSSPFILREEVPALLRRSAVGGIRIIPVLLRPCAWEEVEWLARLQMVPRDGKALSSLPEYEIDTVLAALARDVAPPARISPAPAVTQTPVPSGKLIERTPTVWTVSLSLGGTDAYELAITTTEIRLRGTPLNAKKHLVVAAVTQAVSFDLALPGQGSDLPVRVRVHFDLRSSSNVVGVEIQVRDVVVFEEGKVGVRGLGFPS